MLKGRTTSCCASPRADYPSGSKKAVEAKAREELGDRYALIAAGEATTIDFMRDELAPSNLSSAQRRGRVHTISRRLRAPQGRHDGEAMRQRGRTALPFRPNIDQTSGENAPSLGLLKMHAQKLPKCKILPLRVKTCPCKAWRGAYSNFPLPRVVQAVNGWP
jgi:hypothetical protein